MFDKKLLFTLVLFLVLMYCVCTMGNKPSTSYMGCGGAKKSYMNGSDAPKMMDAGVSGADMDMLDDQYAPADHSGANIDLNIGCAMNAGVGLASSLLPREMASQEDFGQFAPDDILKGQNFLDPRNQIGYPETIGGTLRNANQQIRAEPPNPKQPYTWNNSTIVPDLMQRKICT